MEVYVHRLRRRTDGNDCGTQVTHARARLFFGLMTVGSMVTWCVLALALRLPQ